MHDQIKADMPVRQSWATILRPGLIPDHENALGRNRYQDIKCVAAQTRLG